MRSKAEYRYKIRRLADYLNMTVWQLTQGYMDVVQMRKASYKDLKAIWTILSVDYQKHIFDMENEEYLV